MYITRIHVKNIQAIKEYTFEFPKTGLVVFTGDNSNGKSIIVRAIRDMVTGKINKPRKRAGLVNRQATFGEITFYRDDGVVLLLHIQREASLTYAQLTRASGEVVTRYLADKTIPDLAKEFGWHYNKDLGISLNIAEDEEALLFYKTPFKTNGILVQESASDTGAEVVAENLGTLIKDARSTKENYKNQINANSIAINRLEFEETEPLREKIDKLTDLYESLVDVYIPNIPDIRPVPNVRAFDFYRPNIPEIRGVPKVKTVELYKPTIPEIRYPTIIDAHCNIPDIISIAKDIEALREQRCPMCGRGFVDCDC